jgi:gentisate 1,2-dioxygenase
LVEELRAFADVQINGGAPVGNFHEERIMSTLATVEELPVAYRQGLSQKNLVALWPLMRTALPHDKPDRRTRPVVWHYADIRPDIIRAADLAPIEKAERRVLALANPGLGLENVQATPSIFIGLQLIMPGETAPNHRHSPSAVRMVIEGEGARNARWRRAI